MPTIPAQQGNTDSQTAALRPSACEAAVAANLRNALMLLRAAQLNALPAGYGNQFHGSLTDSIKGVECTMGMLA